MGSQGWSGTYVLMGTGVFTGETYGTTPVSDANGDVYQPSSCPTLQSKDGSSRERHGLPPDPSPVPTLWPLPRMSSHRARVDVVVVPSSGSSSTLV